jgi:general secretion pathway protein D
MKPINRRPYVAKDGRETAVYAFALGLLLSIAGRAGAAAPAAAVLGHTAPPNRSTSAGTLTNRVSFNFRHAPVDAVLDYLSQAYGFIVLKSDHVDSHVTITSMHRISADEAVNALDSVLRPLNYTLIRTGRELRVVALDKAAKSNVPVHFGADPSQIADTNQIITQVIPIQSVDATTLQKDLTPLLSSTATIASNAASNTLIITDTSADIRRIAKIIADLDQVRSSVSSLRVFQLKYADATSIATLINSAFNPPQTANQTPAPRFVPPFMRRFANMMRQNAQASTAGNQIGGQINATADERTDTVVVTGPRSELRLVAKVIHRIDSNPAVSQVFFIYHLENGSAAEIQYELNTLFGNPATPPQSSSGLSNTFGATGSNGRFGTFGNSGGTTSFGGAGSFGGATLGAVATGRAVGVGAAGASGSAATNPLTGQAFIVADTDTNSLLVTTNEKYAHQVKNMIKQLDEPVPQVLINGLVAEVNVTHGLNFGTQFSIMNQRTRLVPSGTVTGSISSTGAVTSATGSATVTPFGSSGGSQFGINSTVANNAANGNPSGFVFGLTEANIQAEVQALESSNRANVLSAPYILASANQQAAVVVGQEVPIITNSTITTQGTVVNTPSYQQVGVILEVTPYVNPDGTVTLQVAPQVSQIEAGTGVTVSPGVTAPIFEIQQAQTQVTVKDGQTIVIGGMIQNQKTKIVSKIPLLGDIPYIGPALFSYTQDSNVKEELVIFLTPHIVPNAGQLHQMTKSVQGGLPMLPHAFNKGVYQQQMKDLQRGEVMHPAASQPVEKNTHGTKSSP